METSKIIYDLRKDKDLSQKRLADLTGISQKAISQIEKGENLPGGGSLISLSKFFGVSVDYLLGLTDDSDIVFVNSELNETEQYLLSQFKGLSRDNQAEALNYINYLANKGKMVSRGENEVDLSGLDDLQKADVIGYINGLKKANKSSNASEQSKRIG